ncbi:hypothetical protein CIPAW_15G120300 [Carya illinoinensis]|uniref:Uncharacterized protein n=1 Tax=Carya illinoinensis TaxID=32201 RepID=A0A8T1NBY6_CARIL|nr:hypothetical protein CIPAW_15G120300 [Carya illinoinensis]
MLIGRRLRFLHLSRYNLSSLVRLPIDNGSSSTAVPDRFKLVKEFISQPISGKLRRLEQPSSSSAYKDLNLRLLGRILRLEHSQKLKKKKDSPRIRRNHAPQLNLYNLWQSISPSLACLKHLELLSRNYNH